VLVSAAGREDSLEEEDALAWGGREEGREEGNKDALYTP